MPGVHGVLYPVSEWLVLVANDHYNRSASDEGAAATGTDESVTICSASMKTMHGTELRIRTPLVGAC